MKKYRIITRAEIIVSITEKLNTDAWLIALYGEEEKSIMSSIFVRLTVL